MEVPLEGEGGWAGKAEKFLEKRYMGVSIVSGTDESSVGCVARNGFEVL